MKELCGKRFKSKSPEEALQAVYALIEGKDPANVGVTVSIPTQSLMPRVTPKHSILPTVLPSAYHDVMCPESSSPHFICLRSHLQWAGISQHRD